MVKKGSISRVRFTLEKLIWVDVHGANRDTPFKELTRKRNILSLYEKYKGLGGKIPLDVLRSRSFPS